MANHGITDWEHDSAAAGFTSRDAGSLVNLPREVTAQRPFFFLALPLETHFLASGLVVE